MHRFLRIPLAAAAVLSLLASGSATAQPVLDILQPSPQAQDPNWEIPGSGFSVSNNSGEVRVYANNHADKLRWNAGFTGFEWFLDDPICSEANDPITWNDPRCSRDMVGLFWKPVACLDGETTCGWGGTWNAYPGEDNISTQPVEWLWPNQHHEVHGTKGYATVIHHLTVNGTTLQPQGTSCANGASVCPPPTGSESCYTNNPNSWATGVANSKAVQVRYSDGSTRWFMALNRMIHLTGTGAGDLWQVLWAYSNDGKSWTIHPQILFRDTSEANAEPPPPPPGEEPGECIGLGLLVSDMLVDEGYFYVTLTRLFTMDVYLLRSPVDTWRYSVPGYGSGGWEVVSGTDAWGRWTWSSVPLGQQVDFPSLAMNVMPNVGTWGGIRQSAVTRVFASSTPHSDSRYVALAAEDNQVWLYTATSLATGPFQRRSQVTLDFGSGVSIGANGLEFGFTHYPDNGPASPRIVDDQLDLWFVTNKYVASGGAPGTEAILDRFTAAIYNLF